MFCNHVQDTEEFIEYDTSYEDTKNNFLFQHSCLLDTDKNHEEWLRREIMDKVEQLIKLFGNNESK